MSIETQAFDEGHQKGFEEGLKIGLIIATELYLKDINVDKLSEIYKSIMESQK